MSNFAVHVRTAQLMCKGEQALEVYFDLAEQIQHCIALGSRSQWQDLSRGCHQLRNKAQLDILRSSQGLLVRAKAIGPKDSTCTSLPRARTGSGLKGQLSEAADASPVVAGR